LNIAMKIASASCAPLLLVLAACGSSGESSIEVAPPAVVRDAAATDAGAVSDASVVSDNDAALALDASSPDGSPADASLPDAGSVADANAASTCGGGSGACTLLDPCAVGAFRCNDAGLPQCTAVATKADGAFCGYGLACRSGRCQAGVSSDEVLLISRLVEAAWFKAVSVWNPSSRAIDLSRYGVCLESNGNAYCNGQVMLTGTLAPNAVLTLCNGTATSPSLCDQQLPGIVNFNGDDRFGLYVDANQNGRVDRDADLRVDHFGEPGVQPSSLVWAGKTFARFKCTPYLGGGPFVTTEWFDEVTPSPDRTSLRAVPVCR
jgi:hypothetical protein